ncbi:protein-disulfide isomerase [Nitrospirillum amazonense]|uniref:Protein-disulfide isomerase n=1 Tax=Nitrospirillum amazonense TaxID=28077 RepID=A0A560EJW9_9PROT|nr:thioredoxin domain-containing protein [Nitrospirillum amazonense]TWB09672.1 protein-disulfide isomerase [Nitrospirillum amazonense]
MAKRLLSGHRAAALAVSVVASIQPPIEAWGATGPSTPHQGGASIDLVAATAPRETGRADAPLVLVEYFSFGCAPCAAFEAEIVPGLRRDFIDTGKARIIYRDFPLDRPSLLAGMLARCISPDRYEAAKAGIFKDRVDWVGTADPVAGLKALLSSDIGADRAETCLSSGPLMDALVTSRQEAESLDVFSTPTLLLRHADGTYEKITRYHNYEELRALLAQRQGS